MDNRAVDVAINLEQAVVGLVVGATRAGHLGALEAKHAVVSLFMDPCPLLGS
jgi:hypothetical protein